MKVHQTFKVVESKSQKYVVCCANRNDDIPCPFYMREIVSKKTNKWKVMQWGGPHMCLNTSITQDHDKLDSDLISTCVVGMILTILIIYVYLSLIWFMLIINFCYNYFHRDG